VKANTVLEQLNIYYVFLLSIWHPSCIPCDIFASSFNYDTCSQCWLYCVALFSPQRLCFWWTFRHHH